MTGKYRASFLARCIYVCGSFRFHDSCCQPKEPSKLLIVLYPKALC
jgi:hypothetical protein